MTQLGIFAKYWQPGRVKTRLARTLGADVSAQLYQLFLATLLQRFCKLADRRVLAYAPPERREQFTQLAASAWHAEPQSAGDLGTRMQHHFRTALAGRGASTQMPTAAAVLIGSDSPDLPERYLLQAFEALAVNDVVLGPTRDGGYYLIGMSRYVPELFAEITWSTPAVWDQTVERLERLGCRWTQLPVWYDVDEQMDLERLIGQLSVAASGEGACEPALEQLYTSVTRLLDGTGRGGQDRSG